MVDNRRNQEELSSGEKEGKSTYKPNIIEPKWQRIWEQQGIYSPNLDSVKKPFYNLMMFPYPSAEGMHVGNMYAFTGADVYGRFMRMQGFDVFEPIGLDGFGIHSENYAIKVGRHPKEQAKISEKNFYRQLHATGNGFDWSRKLETYDPKYYKWTQWLFIQLFKAGLAYRKKAAVNFCPSCKTVLADEQVIKKLKAQSSKLKVSVGVCERCETEVVKKELEQWFFRITEYANRILANLAKLDWSEKVKIAQKQWIGRSEGAQIEFKIHPDHIGTKFKIQVFTTRADTLYGATFLVLSSEHRLVSQLIKKEIASSQASPDPHNDKLKEIKKYTEQANKKTEQERMAGGKEKTGVFTGLYGINPLNDEEIPVWIADYAVMGYGTGALFGDAHDERDVEFAKKYKIPLKPTIITGDKDRDERIKNLEECYTGEGILYNSGEFSGLSSKEAKKKIVAWLERKGSGRLETTYHLRDWLISRQRYWGPPIPMIYCEACAKKGNSGSTLTKKSSPKEDYLVNLKADSLNSWPDTLEGNIPKQNKNVNDCNSAGWFPVPEKDLPVLLPDIKDWKPKGIHSTSSGQAVKSPLATVENFVNTTCPNCNGPAKRETDVSDTFLDSSWYFLRYLATDMMYLPFPSPAFINSKFEARNSKQIQNSNVQNSKQFRISDFDIRVSARRAARWLPVNMYIGGVEHSVLHLLYARFITMVLNDLGFTEFEEPFSRFYAHGLLIKQGAKMSKSKGNVVVPDEYIKKYGADTLRMYLMFLGPFNQGGDFYDTGIEGMHRFLNRVWRLIADSCHPELVSESNSSENEMPKQVRHDINKIMMHKTIKKVTEDISSLRYNTAIASLMTWCNFLKSKVKSQKSKVTQEEIETYLKLLAPFAPHVTEELWQQLKVSKDKKVSKVSNGERSPFDTFSSIHLQPWPSYDPKFLEEDEVTIVVQVNGKVRDTMEVQSSKFKVQSYVEELARRSKRVGKYLEGKSIKKVVYVEGKVVNLVTND